jgi:thiamine transport system substrate-binding protein
MYVYPVDTSVKLPTAWAKFATVSPHPYAVPAQRIAAKRAAWLRAWGDITSQ